jgi:hypothetical protein
MSTSLVVQPRLTGVVVVYVIGLALAACSQSDRNLQRRIAREAHQSAGTLVRLASLTEFSWERLYVFGPYASQEVIDRELGFSWSAAASTGIFDSDGIALLVFVDGGEVVRHVAHPRSEGDFADVKTPGGLTRAQAVFTVDIDARGRRVFQVAEPGRRSNGPLQSSSEALTIVR